MRDGALKLSFVDGQITGASTNPGMGAFYARLFADSRKKAAAEPTNVEAGIQVIVFGTFLLEAVCNDFYRQFLCGGIHDAKLADAIWRSTKRLSIQEKVDIACAASVLDPSRIDERRKTLKVLFDLRNRLAHFKDDDTVWDAPIDFVSKPENWLEAPDPELMGHLTGQKATEYASEIENLLTWFNQIFGVKTTIIDVPASSP